MLTEDIKQPFIGNIIELWEIDISPVSGTANDVIRLSPHIEGPTLWRGNTYDPFPLESSSPEKALNRAPGRITLSISNVNKMVFLKVLEFGDLIGAKVNRWRTLSKYLDNGSTPDAQEHWPLEQYVIIQTSEFSRRAISFTLANKLNIPNVKLPKRQILKEEVPNSLTAPGIGLSGISRR